MESKDKIKSMFWILCFSIILMAIKFYAYYSTHSNAILTDALESIVNVIGGGFALFSIWYASKPKDHNHPYGHGKIEYMSAGFEGGLILVAGIVVIVKSIYGLLYPKTIHSLDTGLLLTVFAGVINFIMGSFLIRKGKKENSLLMIADGKHLISDTVSSVGLVVGLIIIYFTDIVWMDNVVAILFGIYIIFTGYQIIRESITSLLDETDYNKMGDLVKILNENRKANWIDFHNLRLLKFGSQLHIDCHVTLPWYNTLEQSHNEISEIEKLVEEKFNKQIELFIHSDPCIPNSCGICMVKDCAVRKKDFIKKIEWNFSNMQLNIKHSIAEVIDLGEANFKNTT